MDLDAPYRISRDPYVDPQSGVLRNLLGLTDAAALAAAEEDITYAAIAAVLAEQPYQVEQIGFDTLKDIHFRVFGSIYDWAGELRTVEISKGSTRFAFSHHLEQAGTAVFAELAAEDWLRGTGRGTFVARLAHYLADLNVLHPFREGNGRAIRTLASVIAYQARGIVIAWQDMTADENNAASAYAYTHDDSLIAAMLDRLIR
ncbi:MAG: Fic family protein [Bifidobacteriaceae bacterium]|jgi:cell filamentation protein|nr:Fic family protein [Bifidobacteriaceae bacterium]